MKNLFGLELNQNMNPAEMFEAIQAHLGEIRPKDEKEEYLVKLVSVFKPLEEYDEQMKELFQWGATEQQLWQVHI